MAEKDLCSNCTVKMAITTVAATEIADGSDIDTLGYESATFLIHSGTLGTGTIDFSIEHSDDDGAGSPAAYAAVAATDLIDSTPTILATEDDSVFKVGYIGKKRWIRIQNVETAGWTSMIHGAVCLLAHPKTGPTAAQIT